jgi:hypothetical protein
MSACVFPSLMYSNPSYLQSVPCGGPSSNLGRAPFATQPKQRQLQNPTGLGTAQSLLRQPMLVADRRNPGRNPMNP